jgi:hypothetical protein
MNRMERNVLSFRAAISKGYEPRLYTYDPARIPLGEMDAVLDFKIWSKRIIAINCYFTKMGTGDKFVVTVFCHPKMGRYVVANSNLDFGQCPENCIYLIQVAMKGSTEKNRVSLVKAEQKGLMPVHK